MDLSKNFISTPFNKDFLIVLLVYFLYYIWLFRSEHVYKGKKDISQIVAFFKKMVNDFNSVLPSSVRISPTTFPRLSLWKPSPSGWMMINTDATMKDGRNALAMVVRDSQGKVLFITAIFAFALPPALAKVKAIEWASTLACKKNSLR